MVFSNLSLDVDPLRLGDIGSFRLRSLKGALIFKTILDRHASVIGEGAQEDQQDQQKR